MNEGPRPIALNLTERVAAVNAKMDIAPIVDNFTAKVACHRFMIPFDVQTPQQNTLKPGQVTIKVDAHLAHVNCIGAKCALWNAEAKECWDVSEKKAHVNLAAVLASIEAFNRLHNQES